MWLWEDVETSGKQMEKAHLKLNATQGKRSQRDGKRQIPEEFIEGLVPAMPEANQPCFSFKRPGAFLIWVKSV